jgi:peptidoglycan hydrolase-like protein with peptidoglycan-binding domain
MKGNRLLTALTLLALAACTQTPKPAPVPAPAPAAPLPPPLVETPAVPAVDPAAFAQAQASLRALGYNPGKASDPADPAFQRALISFQKDQGLDQDGMLGPQVMEKLRVMRAALRTVPSCRWARSRPWRWIAVARQRTIRNGMTCSARVLALWSSARPIRAGAS